MIDWVFAIVRMAYWKQKIAEVDIQKLVPWHLPSVAAEQSMIDEAEVASGIVFPQGFKAFLIRADGWRGFLMDADLAGVAVISRGFTDSCIERFDLENYLKSLGLSSIDVASIGASKSLGWVIILVSMSSKILPGGVLLYNKEEIDRYDSFEEFFESMIAGEEAQYEDLREENIARGLITSDFNALKP